MALVLSSGEAVAAEMSSVASGIATPSRTTADIHAVEAPASPLLTASFEDAPARHDGSTVFGLTLRFSAPIQVTERTLYGGRIEIGGGQATRARRAYDSTTWTIRVKPHGGTAVSLSLRPNGRPCDMGGLCTIDGQRLAATASITIPGPDSPLPRVSVSAGDTVSEGATADFTLTRSGPTHASLTVSVEIAESGSMLSAETPTSATFHPGDATFALNMATEDDSVSEAASTVTATMTAGEGYAVSTDAAAASVTVIDDDAPVYTVAARPTTVDEGDTSSVVVSTGGVTFAAPTSFTSATAGTADASDYSLSASTLTLVAGATSVTATISTIDDGAEEADETVTVVVARDGNRVGAATIRIIDNDAARSSSDATLATFALSGIEIGAFSAATTSYTASVGHAVAVTTVTATPTDAAASVTIADANGSTVGTSRTSSLAAGTNTIFATVTAEDETTLTYSATVIRALSSSGLSADAGWDLTVASGHTAFLDGTGSKLPVHTVASWSFLSWPGNHAPRLDNPSSMTPEFTPTDEGTYVLQLLLGEGKASSVDTVTVTVVPSSQAATLTAADLLADANRNGVVDASDDAGEDSWDAASGAVFIPNVDDDDGDGRRDALDARVNGMADLEDMSLILVKRIKGLNRRHTVTLQSSHSSTGTGPQLFLERASGHYEPLAATGAQLPPKELVAADLRVYLDAPYGRHVGFNGEVAVTLKLREADTTVSDDTITFRGSPVLYSHAMQAGQRVFVVHTVDNDALRNALHSHLPQSVVLEVLRESRYGTDRWAQDFMQASYVQRPARSGVETVRTQTQMHRPSVALATYLGADYLGADAGYVYPGARWENTLNHGGNVEVIPPYAHNGKTWPFGRIVIGGTAKRNRTSDPSAPRLGGMAEEQRGFFNAQGLQAPPIQVRTDWLDVAHVDELFQVVVDRNASSGDRGWVVVIGSPDAAIDALKAASADGWGHAVVFRNRDDETTIDGILDDQYLLDDNDRAQTYINSVRSVLISEVGLTNDDFVEVPAMFTLGRTGMISYFPNIQNLLAVGHVILLADPEGPDVNGVDLWQQAARDALDELGHSIHFVDIYDSYHLRLGAIHCAIGLEHHGEADPWWTHP